MTVIACDSFKFDKRAELLIGVHNKARSVVPMRVSNPDRSPLGINGCDPAQTPAGFLEILSDYFPVYVPTLEYG
jgi:hypothetical protein